jgi:hypothetical protein
MDSITVNTQGNEDADTEAKRGATHTNVKCQHAVITTWILTESKRQFLLAWKQKLKPSLQYPPQMSSYKWTETRALTRVYCNRSPTDSGPYKQPTQCDTCNIDATSEHFLTKCPLVHCFNMRQTFLIGFRPGEEDGRSCNVLPPALFRPMNWRVDLNI